MDLFGMESVPEVPVAALTRVSDRNLTQPGDGGWLQLDPVTLQAGMTQVFMTSHGFADLDIQERNDIESCVRSILREEGLELHSDHLQRWYLALDEPLEFHFTPLEMALGMDVAEAMPGHPAARPWRRSMNEIQVALHHCPVNVRRRESGRQEINSVWFWGAGCTPAPAPHPLFGAVYSDNPVTRGLAIVNGCQLENLDQAVRENFSLISPAVLIDWSPATHDARREFGRLDALVGQLVAGVGRGTHSLTLLDGAGDGRVYDRAARRRFWRRRTPLVSKPARPAAR